MEKRGDISSNGGNGVKPDIIEKPHRLKKPERVWVRSLYPAYVLWRGKSGEKYAFVHSGAKVKVNAMDVADLLAKRRGGCCGAAPSPMFELV
jgi:hypothetical protein